MFGMSGGGATPAWVAVPNQGYAPLTVAKWPWSFHSDKIGGSVSVSMLRVDDNAPLAVSVQSLPDGYGQNAISWAPSGWTVEAGKTYRVTIAGIAGGNVTYDVKPVGCP